MKYDNRGMSLVEIMVIIGIMSILIGVAGYGLSLSSTKDVDECAQKMLSTIQHSRTATMGKNATTVKFYIDANGKVMADETSVAMIDASNSTTNTTTKTIGKKTVSVSYSIAGKSFTDLSSAELILKFNRASGALEQANSDVNPVTEIKIYKDGKTRLIKIAPLTGKATLVD